MSQLNSKKRAQLPKSAFAYVDSRGRKRLPINDESHVRNALARFNQVIFEDEAARERARTRLLNAAKKYGIVPVGFITGQIRSEGRHAAAGRLVIELGRMGAAGEPRILPLSTSGAAAAHDKMAVSASARILISPSHPAEI